MPPPEEWPDSEGPPTEGWFVFAGTSDAEADRMDCLYRWEPASAPIEVFCPAALEPVEEPPSRLLGAAGPADGSGFAWAMTEEFALDQYPEYIWRIDARTGDTEYVASWDADPNGGPSRHLQTMIPVDDECVAWQIRVQPLGGDAFDQLGVSCVGEFPDPEFGDSGVIQELRGVLDDGRLLVEVDSGLQLIDPMSGEATMTGIGSDAFAHDGQRIAFVAAGEFLDVRAALWDDGTVTEMNDPLPRPAGLGFLPSGDVLVGSAPVLRWNGTDATDGVRLPGLDIALATLEFVPVGDYTGFRVSESDTEDGIAFASDIAVSSVCGPDHRARGVAKVSDSGEVVLVYTQTDPESEHKNHVFSCRPNGEPVDLLEGTGLRGKTLPTFDSALGL
jgi:hypothetical protein